MTSRPSHLTVRLTLAWFLLSTALLVAPIYTWLGNSIEPRVFGQPWSLVWVLGVIAINTLVLAVAYHRRWVDDAETDDAEVNAP